VSRPWFFAAAAAKTGGGRLGFFVLVLLLAGLRLRRRWPPASFPSISAKTVGRRGLILIQGGEFLKKGEGKKPMTVGRI